MQTGEAAAALGVTSVTLLRWAHEGKVRPALITAGGHYRWRLDELRQQLADLHEVEQPPQQPIVAAIVTSKLGVLIGRRRDGRPPWTFIAGEVEPGEHAADTAVREVKEETGLEVRVGQIIGERDHPASGRHMIYMSARPSHGTKIIVGDLDELAEVKWAGLGEAVELLPGMFPPVLAYLARTLG